MVRTRPNLASAEQRASTRFPSPASTRDAADSAPRHADSDSQLESLDVATLAASSYDVLAPYGDDARICRRDRVYSPPANLSAHREAATVVLPSRDAGIEREDQLWASRRVLDKARVFTFMLEVMTTKSEILRLIAVQGPLKDSDLARLLGVAHQQVNQAARALVAAGVISRAPGPDGVIRNQLKAAGMEARTDTWPASPGRPCRVSEVAADARRRRNR